jgi:hypothetical protein
MLAWVVISRHEPRPMHHRNPTSRHRPDPSAPCLQDSVPQSDSPRNRRLPRPGRGVLCVSALDCSSLGFPLNLQSKIPTQSGLSTFNRLSFPFPASPLPYFPLCPSRDGKLVTATPLDSALTNGDARKSFRIRSYANCRVGLLFLTKFSETKEEVFLTKFSEIEEQHDRHNH